MQNTKKIPVPYVSSLLNLMSRDANHYLHISRQSLEAIASNKEQANLNISLLQSDHEQRLLSFVVNKEAQAIIGEEYTLSASGEEYRYSGSFNIWDLLVQGQIKNILYIPEHSIILSDVILDNAVLLAGSFNPLHQGHTNLLKASIETIKEDCFGVFELSISNASKSTITQQQLFERLEQFRVTKQIILVTNNPFFREKMAYLDNKSWFCVGADTYKRIFDQKFYSSEEQLKDFVMYMLNNGIHMIVGPRMITDELAGKDTFLENVPDFYKHMVKEVEQFRIDISSTEIRSGLAQVQL